MPAPSSGRAPRGPRCSTPRRRGRRRRGSSCVGRTPACRCSARRRLPGGRPSTGRRGHRWYKCVTVIAGSRSDGVCRRHRSVGNSGVCVPRASLSSESGLGVGASSFVRGVVLVRVSASAGVAVDTSDDSTAGADGGRSGAAVSPPPARRSSARRGTRSWRPTRTTGRPSRPSGYSHRWASTYAEVRPMRCRRPASTTVRKSGRPPTGGSDPVGEGRRRLQEPGWTDRHRVSCRTKAGPDADRLTEIANFVGCSSETAASRSEVSYRYRSPRVSFSIRVWCTA